VKLRPPGPNAGKLRANPSGKPESLINPKKGPGFSGGGRISRYSRYGRDGRDGRGRGYPSTQVRLNSFLNI